MARPQTKLQREVVLADGDESCCCAVTRTLEGFGWTTHIARRGADAVELSRIIRPKLILLELDMPDVDGFQTCARIRSEAWSRRTVIAAVSGMPREEVEQRALSCGFDLVLIKPLDGSRLQAILGHPDLA
jgi:DNA-binding response OmpR family regulator